MDAVHASSRTSAGVNTSCSNALPAVETDERPCVTGSAPNFVHDESVTHDPLDDETRSNVADDDHDGFGGFGGDLGVDEGDESDFSGDDIMVDTDVGHRKYIGNGNFDGDVGIVNDSDVGTKQPAVALLIL